MPVNTLTNRYPFPQGYRHGVLQPSSYVPWNGYISTYNSPGANFLGAVLSQVVTAVPTDLQTIQIFAPDGKEYLFQFVYNFSVQTQGIKIPLPLSGGSTAAQVATAMLAVMGLATGIDFAGVVKTYPWNAQQTNATTIRLNFTRGGSLVSYAYPGNITATALSQGGVAAGAVQAAVIGRLPACLPG